MANTPRVFYRGIVPASTAPAALLVPAGNSWTLTNIVVTNYGAVVAQVWVTIGGTSIIHEFALDPRDVLAFDCKQVCPEGTQLSLWASTADTMTAHVSGVETDGAF